MAQRQGTHVPAVRAASEKNLGITQRSASINFSWTGDIRKRYTDFLVYEIRKDGSTVHLREYEEQQPSVPKPAPAKPTPETVAPSTEPEIEIKPVSDEDRKKLVDLIGESATEKLIKLNEAVQAKQTISAGERTVVFDPITDRAQRASLHQEIRRIFDNRIETLANNTGVITATPSKWSKNNRVGGHGPRANNSNNSRSRDQSKSFTQLGGEYLHFTMYKENKDTMDAVNTIARLLKVKATNFGFAGTKDRRAGTVQRISVHRQRASNLIWLNTRLPNIKVGDFSHSKEPLQLGQHGGNEFVITLKNCKPLGGAGCSVDQRVRKLREAVEFGLAYLQRHGYINYYGLQRFGTYAIGTHLLGMKVLKEDYEGVLDDILHVEDHFLHEAFDLEEQEPAHTNDFHNSRDDYNRAKAITIWKTTRNAEKALAILPKRFSSEAAIIRHLGKNSKDFMGALLSITRGMRMMYIHAYQSYVWNHMASKRWAMYGPTVVEGDLVLVSNDQSPADADSEDNENFYAQARALTQEDIASGKYTIFDVVLPTPGYDVIYPRNEIGKAYVDFMKKTENGGLDPYDMRRRQKEFSLSGNYRHLLGRFIGEPQYAIRVYNDDTEQMYPTDLDFCNAANAKKKAATAKARTSPPLLANWAHFTNNTAQYDQAITNERRRKASQSPESGVVVARETWIQTGLDGSDKRVKIARHTEEYETKVPVEKINEMVADNATNGIISSSATETPTLAKGLSDLYYESAAQQTVVKSEDGTTKQEQDVMLTEESTASKADTMEVDAATHEATPQSNQSALADTENSMVISNSEKDGTTKTKEAANLIVPVLHSPSENPLASVDNSEVIRSSPDASKLAVILKFQLRSSNYATVVLRELMGTLEEEDAADDVSDGN
ncbi:pseudouridine synthase TruD/Pus7 [Neurospora crassa OR74A]|uniref:Pseudouridine synthase TruD/Pus7 n=1 Tax=Neurospora crassa (strain ATCC 24698 / 74-OR23-1A / CBS 708.71 / DSM 1257 / FGSC 987) TaxID=367110 RepID=Q7RYY7_NEUCR|nr:pseudouridine synthase TruD/Pus7 [Neurospora crassa OR74A]EAA28083.1 pseudouridine synthase TruD/Pus7 [Neurospora crassa OR74A]|eukprot:XP_957319.1 pseudouridine synthase TruD/Pus7 [Neurospora crassa OR74A]